MEKNTLLQYIGNTAQIGGSRHYTLTDGQGRNMRGIDVNTGAGLQYTILPDRGMDISLACYKGHNLVYISPNGETHPAFFEPENYGWLRTFTGGLLTTCGLTYLGHPVKDGEDQLGLHGRYSTLPARQVADLSGWTGNEYHIRLQGITEEGHIFGTKMRLEREITSIQGQNKLIINDTVTNFGYSPAPYTILYHMNLGYPLLSEKAVLILDPKNTIPASTDSETAIDEFRRFSKPVAGFREHVFYHKMKGNSKGETSVSLENKALGIALTIKFRIKELPWLTQWKMLGQGDYVLGLEPCNVPPKNRVVLKNEGILPYLKPGESTTNSIEIILSDSLK
jgi:galactose mutarotase-like enzyme